MISFDFLTSSFERCTAFLDSWAVLVVSRFFSDAHESSRRGVWVGLNLTTPLVYLDALLSGELYSHHTLSCCGFGVNATLREILFSYMVMWRSLALAKAVLRRHNPGLMARILSISYNPALLDARSMILMSRGFEVDSVLSFFAAIDLCKASEYDLVIIGHSIPAQDKLQIIAQLRAVCEMPILSLHKPNESPLKTANYNLDSGDAARFLDYVSEILQKKELGDLR